MKYAVIRISKRFQGETNFYESCFEVIGNPHNDLNVANQGKKEAEVFYPSGEKFIIIQIWE